MEMEGQNRILVLEYDLQIARKEMKTKIQVSIDRVIEKTECARSRYILNSICSVLVRCEFVLLNGLLQFSISNHQHTAVAVTGTYPIECGKMVCENRSSQR